VRDLVMSVAAFTLARLTEAGVGAEAGEHLTTRASIRTGGKLTA
jgi:hypothetical protein